MAKIVGGIATSHTPTIGFALDAGKQNDPVWAPIFEGYAPVRAWLEEKKPDVLFVIYNDHITSFFFDHYSHFALGVGERIRGLLQLRGVERAAQFTGGLEHVGRDLMAARGGGREEEETYEGGAE